jgi:hypothetical protein
MDQAARLTANVLVRPRGNIWGQRGPGRKEDAMTMAEGAPTVGAEVYTADGDKLGKVKDVAGTCFKVDAPMRPDYWLAADCVTSSSAGEVRLNVTKDSLGSAKVEGPGHTGVHSHDDGGTSP